MTRKVRAVSERARGERRMIDTQRQLARVRTLAQLRAHLATGLANLPLPEEVRRDHQTLVGNYVPLLKEESFWSILEEVHRQPRNVMSTFAAAYFRRYERMPPTEWVSVGARIVGLLGLLRMSPSDVSSHYRRRWLAGSAHGLLAMMRADGVRAVWVQRAITDLQQRQQTGSPEEQQRATEILLQVGPALAGAETVGGERARLDRAAIEARAAASRHYSRESRARQILRERLPIYRAELAAGSSEEQAAARAAHGLRKRNRERLLRKLRQPSAENET